LTRWGKQLIVILFEDINHPFDAPLIGEFLECLVAPIVFQATIMIPVQK